ncbi:protein disulfide oxidoreductase [Mycolicibacterium sp.]|uniref:protein disulfide oxidoreductase n=1 Tax=Mycolicibacterium sp. TaxID=2320850 RepID=UPI003D09D80E
MIAVLAVTAAVATACGSSSEADPTAEPTPSAVATTSAAAASPAPAEGQPAIPAQLQFNATTINGESFSGESLAGKPAVLWFWAPWCPTCQREAPMVGQISAANPDVTFLGVAGLAEVPAMKEFVDKYPVDTFTQLADTDGAVWTKFGVTQQPAFAFLNADGNIEVVRGTLSEPELTQRVQALSAR